MHFLEISDIMSINGPLIVGHTYLDYCKASPYIRSLYRNMGIVMHVQEFRLNGFCPSFIDLYLSHLFYLVLLFDICLVPTLN
jgi:hypothetical protein